MPSGCPARDNLTAMRDSPTKCTDAADRAVSDSEYSINISEILRYCTSMSSLAARFSAIAIAIGSLTACGMSDVQDPAMPSTLAIERASYDATSNGGASDKADVCHRTNRKSDFTLISVAPSAIEAHLAHGDGLLGEAVPGQFGMRFGSNCQPELIPFDVTLHWSARGMIRDADHDGVGDAAVLNDPLLQIVNGFVEERRGVLEFGITQFTHPVGHADLTLVVSSAVGHTPFNVYVYMYAGDGAATVSDFVAGSLVATFSYTGQTQVTLDVTSALNTLIASHATFAGVNLRVQEADVVWGPRFIVFDTFDHPAWPTTLLDVRTP